LNDTLLEYTVHRNRSVFCGSITPVAPDVGIVFHLG